MVTPRDKPSEASSDAWGVGVDDVLAALQATMRRADERLSKAKGGIQYVATDVTVSFPAEINVQEDRTMVRFPSRIGTDIPSVPESHLSRLTFSLKPVPSIEEEAVKPVPSPVKPVRSPVKPGPSPVKPEKPPAKPEKPVKPVR